LWRKYVQVYVGGGCEGNDVTPTQSRSPDRIVGIIILVKYMDTPNNNSNTSAMPEKKDSHLMAIFSYLGPLVIIPFLTSKNDPFIKFHIKQGLVLFIIEVLISVIAPMFFWSLWGVMRLLNLATLILSIIGIVNVVQKKEKTLPLVGGFSKYFTF
jgi:uncharacterized membrane protein